MCFFMCFLSTLSISHLQTSGSAPGEDFDVQNWILQSKMTYSFDQSGISKFQNLKNWSRTFQKKMSRLLNCERKLESLVCLSRPPRLSVCLSGRLAVGRKNWQSCLSVCLCGRSAVGRWETALGSAGRVVCLPALQKRYVLADFYFPSSVRSHMKVTFSLYFFSEPPTTAL